MFLSSNKFVTFELKKYCCFESVAVSMLNYWKLKKNQGLFFCLVKFCGDIAGRGIVGAPRGALLNSCFERPLEIFLERYTEGFFSVCHVLVLVNRLPGHFSLLFETTGQMLLLFQLGCLRKWRIKMGTPHLLFWEQQLQCFATFFILGGFPLYYVLAKSKIGFYWWTLTLPLWWF